MSRTAATKLFSSIANAKNSRILPQLSRQTRCISSSSSWVTIEHLPDDERIALVKLQRPPANALSLEFCQELSKAIRTLETDGTTNTMILSSGLPNSIFSAGLDISTELYQPDHDRLPEFWKSFQQLFLDLYGTTQLTTIAALQGPAPAGGCMLALSCDYRVANSNTSIGLNESHLGIVAPPWMCQQYTDILGHRQAELALISGTLFSAQQALDVGLVDDLAEDVPSAAVTKAKEWVNIPQAAKGAVKELTRGPLVDKLVRDRDTDTEFFCNFVTADPVQMAIGRYLEALKSKGKT